jgi:hypothetical protein
MEPNNEQVFLDESEIETENPIKVDKSEENEQVFLDESEIETEKPIKIKKKKSVKFEEKVEDIEEKVDIEEKIEDCFWDKYKTYLFGLLFIVLLYVSYLYLFGDSFDSCKLEPFHTEIFESVGNLTNNVVHGVSDSIPSVTSSVKPSST